MAGLPYLTAYGVDRILREHNPEHDIDTGPGAPPVTWAEVGLARAVVLLVERIEKLEMEVARLQGSDDGE